MKQISTQAIVLGRIDYGEADRILTLLTPDNGKLSLIAKGVRRIKSKLAGGIELFSVSDISFARGRGEVGTLVSTRLVTHYGNIVADVSRTMAGYDLIKQLHKATEDEPEPEYFTVLEQAFGALNDASVDLEVIRVWFAMQLLRLGGHTPNLETDTAGDKLAAGGTYGFSFDDMGFFARPDAPFRTDHIKLLRIGFAGTQPAVLQKITGIQALVHDVQPLIRTMAQTYVRSM